MPTKVNLAAAFQRDIKRLRKKYPTVGHEVRNLVHQLEEDHRLGDKIPNIGYDVYKVRLKNPSAGKGKRGGFRVIYYLKLADEIILLTIYTKTEQVDISTDEIQQILENLPLDDE